MTNLTPSGLPENRIDLSIVIPVYNECESLRLLHQKIVSAVEPLNIAWEVVYIDDGSKDGSAEILQDLQRADPHVVVGCQRRNFGKSLALASGFALARGNYLVTMDADLQDEPMEIPHLLAKLEEGWDVVIGWRQQRLDTPQKRFVSWIANTVTAFMTGLSVHDMNTGLKAYRRDCVERLSLYGDMHRYIPIIAHYMGFRIVEVPVVHQKRRFGKSKYNASRLLRGGLDLITVLFLSEYSNRPLHLFGTIGGVLFMAGVGISAMLGVEWIEGIRPIGTRPLFSVGIFLMLIGGQIMSLGLVAELMVAFVQRTVNPLNKTIVYLSPNAQSARSRPMESLPVSPVNTQEVPEAIGADKRNNP
jgi:glycosyltransferase involved in cell wall biosynthesis